ncbi:MAG: DUF1080 domain-containing protein [Bacteroidetes bacterium]|nr:DUF1080 domain-containing protein [Bacteroidota bacterium]
MKHFFISVFVAAVLSSAGQPSKNEWTSLFNGKDLSGFKQLNGKAKYRVENGEIIGTTVFGEPNSFLATEKTYGDFVLELDLKMFANMNSGVQFRSQSGNASTEMSNSKIPDRVFGYQAEVDPSSRAWSGGIYDEARRGWLYTLENNPAAKAAFKPTDWNRYRIECIGNHIRTWINGVPCAYVIDDMTPVGFIALQVHAIQNKTDEGKEIHWKNIRIKTTNLKPSPSNGIFVVNLLNNTISEEEKRLGYSLLWDGATGNGWRSANGAGFPAKGWSISNGELILHNEPPTRSMRVGDIVTEKEYSAFDLQFEFKITDTANSGVKYFVQEYPEKRAVIGLEYQILDDAKHPDAKAGAAGNRTMASLYDLIPAAPGLDSKASRRDRIPVGQWNRARIVVYPDGKVEHWLNGWKMVEYQRGGPIFLALVARSKFATWPQFGTQAKGRILLQDHGDKVSFRSIKIKELSNQP